MYWSVCQPYDVVVDGHLRVPVADVVDLAVLPLAERAVVGRDLVAPLHSQLYAVTRLKRVRQGERENSSLNAVLACIGVAFCYFFHHTPVRGKTRQVEAAGHFHIAATWDAFCVDILAELDGQEGQVVRGVVLVRYRAFAGQRILYRVNRCAERVDG